MRLPGKVPLAIATMTLLVPRAALAATSEAAGTSRIAEVAFLLALVLAAAKFGGEVAARLKQPPVLGELLAGVLLGNLPWRLAPAVAGDPGVDLLSQLGVLILLFEVGVESTVRDVLAVGVAALRVAVFGTFGTLIVGFLCTSLVLPHASVATRLFLGASITATSIGVTARVFKDLGRTRGSEARTILGAAVLDDVIALVFLAVASSLLTSGVGTFALAPLCWLLLKTLGFLFAAVALGARLTPRLFTWGASLRTRGSLLTIGLGFCFALSWAAQAMGLAPLVGAFAAGLVLEELHSARFVARGERSLSELIEPVSQFLVPIFFVVMGVRADVSVLLRADTLLLVAGLTVAAILGKLACGLGAARGVNRLAVACGMLPRGEVSLIFASLGMTLVLGGSPVLDRRAYSALVAVVILTTLLTPALLRWSFERRSAQPTLGSGA